MEWIDDAAPKTLSEAVQLMASHGERARVIAGGTDILVQLRGGRRSLDLLVDVKAIPELNQISYNAQSGLVLGAAIPCYKIYQNQAVASAYPGLIDAASLIGGIQIQGRATLGGNMCNAAPSGDSIPPVIVMAVSLLSIFPVSRERMRHGTFAVENHHSARLFSARCGGSR